MDAIRVTGYRQLLAAIAALPPPSEGAVRVFRGQTKDYGTLLSSMGRIRRTRPASEAFDVSIRHWFIKSGLLTLVSDLLQAKRLSAIDVEVSPSHFVLAEALIQHYGYQTTYIDITPSIEVALWFATHKFEGKMDSPYGAAPPFRLTFPAWHRPADAPGVVYVLDVQPWDGVSGIQEGEYVDLLSIAPEGVNRPRRQVGGLVYAREDLYGLVGAKFEIGFPWEEVGEDWPTDYVFPGPDQDPIYSNLLRAPFFRTFRTTENGEETVFRRVCTLPEYCASPDDAPRLAMYRTYDRALKPTLYHPWLMRNLDQAPVNDGSFPKLRPMLERASPIMLQRPMILFTLRRGGPPAPPAEPPSDVPFPLRNFFLEYAPENYPMAYEENCMARGFWCCWLDDHRFLVQSYGARAGKPVALPFFLYEWQPGRGLVCTTSPEAMGTYATFPLELIRMAAEGQIRFDPPSSGQRYFDLTTTEKFWPALFERTDLI